MQKGDDNRYRNWALCSIANFDATSVPVTVVPTRHQLEARSGGGGGCYNFMANEPASPVDARDQILW